ncbi:MAG: aminopeptidase P family protein [Anaerolineales bacterium]|nr:MAG: aminopeptidase P family protein [Anaerolineales bacterium]
MNPGDIPSFPSVFKKRQAKLGAVLTDTQLDSLILNPGPSLLYLTGLHFHLSERPVLVFFFPNATPLIVLPELELQKLKDLPYEIQGFPYGEDPETWGNSFQEVIQAANLGNQRNGVEPRQMRLLEYRLLVEAAPKGEFIPAGESVSTLRMYKDEDELFAMHNAVQIAQQALKATLHQVKIGMTEREVAAELTLQLFKAGSDPEMPFAPIVSAGSNAANPHATPTERKLTAGDLLVIDWGASHSGYISDITRTFAIGNVDPEYEKIHQIVLHANEAGRSAVRPGIPAEAVDHAARRVIDASGYGKYFTHRTGHGLGMESHEDPYIRDGNRLLLTPGMTFTIEPGIYLPGRNGVRIEDDVVITQTGAESLTDFPREFTQLF